MSTEKIQDMKKLQAIYEDAVRDEQYVSGLDAPSFQLSPCVLDDGAVIYANEALQAGWWAFRIGWQASRAAIEVELPKIVDKEWANTHAERSAMREAIEWCKKRIESLGLKVKP